MKKNTYYFSHDYNAANDVKILFLRQKYGIEGYGVYWFIVESLAQSGGELPLSIIPVLSMQMQVDVKMVEDIITSFGLFVSRGTIFVSERLLNHLDLRNKLVEKGKQGAAKRWGNREAIGNPNGKEIKGNEIDSLTRIVIR
jgi:hypothetical protein